MKDPHTKQAFSPSQDADDPSQQGCQFIDMTFSASKSASASTRRRPSWPRSLDSQEFGFASNPVGSSEVAPADELFYKGQLVPLQLDHRHHLVKALSASCSFEQISSHSARVASTTLANDLCVEDEVIEFNSCRLEREVSLDYLKQSCMSSSSISHVPIPEDGLCYINRDNNLSLCPHKCKACTDVDCAACTQYRWLADHNAEHDVISLYEDGQIYHHSHDSGAANYKGAHTIDSMTDPGSSSFRSQNSGFWDSGADKDMMDSSSSRDSNGSSQDSYFHPQHTDVEAPHFIHESPHPHNQLSFNIPWRLSIFRTGRGLFRKQAFPQVSSSSFSEDLGKYKACVVPPLKEFKEALLQGKLVRESGSCKPEKQGKERRRLPPIGSSIHSSSASVMTLCKGGTDVHDANVKKLTVCDKSSASSSKAIDAGTVAAGREAVKKQGSAAVRERWQQYARRLKPLYEMKKGGWMGQLRMDECGKRAYYEVDQGTLQSARPACRSEIEQKRLSNQTSSSNLWKGHKLPASQQRSKSHAKTLKPNPYAADYTLLAMSSCPTSAISSPNHSGVLAVIDTNNQRSSTSKPANSGKLLNQALRSSAVDGKSSGNASNAGNVKSSGLAFNAGNNCTSMSTMHELHSAVQSAIAHCKESNKKLNYAAT